MSLENLQIIAMVGMVLFAAYYFWRKKVKKNGDGATTTNIDAIKAYWQARIEFWLIQLRTGTGTGIVEQPIVKPTLLLPKPKTEADSPEIELTPNIKK
jgi:hypothetical protein